MNGEHVIVIIAELTVLGLIRDFSFQKMQKVMMTILIQVVEELTTLPLMTQRERSSGPRRSTRIASISTSNSAEASTSTSLSPLIAMLEVTGPAPFPMEPSSPTLPHNNVALPPLTSNATTAAAPAATMQTPLLNNRFTITIPPYVLPAGREPDFNTFEEFENHVNANRCPDILSAEDLFSVEGDSITDAATGLVAALMNVHGEKDVPLRAQRVEPTADPAEIFTGHIHPNYATLERIFSSQHWMFRG